MDQHTITILVGDEESTITVSAGESLHHGIVENSDTVIDAPCGGKGKCGKCKVIVESGAVSDVTDQERKLLSDHELERGVRLACLTYPRGDVEVRSHDPNSPIIVLENISAPEEVYDILRRAVRKARKDQGLTFQEEM